LLQSLARAMSDDLNERIKGVFDAIMIAGTLDRYRHTTEAFQGVRWPVWRRPSALGSVVEGNNLQSPMVSGGLVNPGSRTNATRRLQR
jgi:hypothetical protein